MMVSAQNGFNHPLEIPDDVRLDFHNVFEVIEQARLGDDNARDTLILGYSKLVLSKVGTWVKLFPHVSHLSDDMVSEGLVAVVKAVDVMIAEGDPDKGSPTAYVNTAIVNTIGTFLEFEGTIHIPRNVDDPPSVIPVDDYDRTAPPTGGGFEVIDFIDELESLCETEQEKIMLQLRMKGYTYKEIADQLHVSKTTVVYIFAEFEQRYAEYEREIES